ncbi:FixH family protein [Evansella sp. AB-P1]|uniref:FixH family protein n=1 Tax=Evansella sp. AB-P1 TaxID=3037653 RepID=UPI00241E4248|nr:FixH family protein [Evansella sp. AB-P1]MDG5789207.1 FixH family protein [Evansella sp. AB-P1]
MKKIVYFMTICTVIIVTMTGCNKSELDTLIVNLKQEGETFQKGEFTTYEVSLKSQQEEQVSVDDVYLYMNMEHMNHPMEGKMEKVRDGIYEIDLPLAMAGEWYVLVNVRHEGEEREIPFHVFAEGDMVMKYMQDYHADEID